MRLLGNLLFCLTLSACANSPLKLPLQPAGMTEVPLSLKNYHVGQELQSCPSGGTGRREGRALYCTLPDKTVGGATVVSAGLSAVDGKVVLVNFMLKRNVQLSQPEVLAALTDKYGPAAVDRLNKTHVWRNGGQQLQLDEVRARLALTSPEGLALLQRLTGQQNAADL